MKSVLRWRQNLAKFLKKRWGECLGRGIAWLLKGCSFICFAHPMFLQGLVQAREGKTLWEDKNPKVFINTGHTEDGDAGSRAVCGIFQGALGCAQPAPRDAVGCAHGSCCGVTGRRWKTPPQNCSWQEGKEGDPAQYTEKHLSSFFQWVEWANPRSLNSIPHFVSETVFFCASLCIPVPAPPSRSHQHSQLALERHRNILNRDYSLHWKHQSLSGYLHRSLAVVLTLVKTAVLGIS